MICRQLDETPWLPPQHNLNAHRGDYVKASTLTRKTLFYKKDICGFQPEMHLLEDLVSRRKLLEKLIS